jgi:SP family general alpha glucoside:H+ symporter-like MFS transporter
MDTEKRSNDMVEDVDHLHNTFANEKIAETRDVQLREDARQATLLEHNLTLIQALKAHPKALFWSIMISFTIIMEGYDTILIGNFYAYPTFQAKYGSYYPGIGQQVSGPWQVGLSNAGQIGPIIGAFANGFLSDRFGYRRVVLATLIGMTATIFLLFFAPNLPVLLVGQLLCGIPWGIFATMGPAYASEVCPLAFRGYLTAYTNMCFAMGQFIAGGVLESYEKRTDQWSYRIPFALQWIYPVPLFCVLWFAPESPWWLVRKGRLEAAEHSVKRLTAKSTHEKAKQTVAMMVHTDNLEKEVDTGTSYLDCFKGIDLRRTEIACISFAGQVLAGSQFAYSGTYFFEQAGLAASNAYKLNLAGTAIAFIGTIISWYLMSTFGRRPIYVIGMFTMSMTLFVIGCLDFGRTTHPAVKWGQAGLAIFWLFSFSLSAGPIGWAVPAEVSSTRLRQKTICLARTAYYIASIVANSIEPYMINPTEWNWRGKTGFCEFWRFRTVQIMFLQHHLPWSLKTSRAFSSWCHVSRLRRLYPQCSATLPQFLVLFYETQHR